MKLTKSRTAKFVAGLAGFAMMFSFAIVAHADTASDLQAQINSLLATIQSLQAQLAATTGGSTVSTGYTFNTNLTVGSKGADVLNLQKFLNKSADTQVAATGAGSPGNETSTFGPATKAAVIKFQTKYGITPAAGYVGAITRAKLNSLGGTTGTTTGTGGTTLPTGGALMVVAGAQPMNSLAPNGAARVPFTSFTVTAGTADVTVNSVTVERGGLAQDAVFAGVVLLDNNGLQIGIAKTLNSNHQAVVGEPFVVKAGTSKTLTVAGNMSSPLTNYAGQVAALNVVAVNTSATVTGALPITGAQQTINASLTIGTTTVNPSSFDPNNGATQPIGTTGYRFSGIRLTAGSAEDVTLKSIRWNQTGSVGSTDLANVMTIVNGTSYPTTVSADGKYYTTIFPTGIVVTKGNSIDVYVQGDIAGSGAAGRYAEFDIYKTTDVYLTGNTYGYGINITGSFGTQGNLTAAVPHGSAANANSNPFFAGSSLSITAGSVTLIGKANEVSAQNIATAVPNQVLGGFATNFSGEPVSVQTMAFVVASSSGTGTGLLTSVTIVDSNGAVVAGPVDATYTDATHQTVSFSDTITFPIGRAVYTMKGKVASTIGNGTVYTVAADTSTWGNVTGQQSGNRITLGTITFNMNPVTVKGASLQVNLSAQPAAQFVVAGAQNFVLANYQLDATQSGEDLRLSSMPVDITAAGGSALLKDLTGCALFNGSTQLNTGSRVVNYVTADGADKTVAYSFDNSLTVAKGTSATLSLQCNIASTPVSLTYQVKRVTDGSAVWAVTGVTSGNSVTGALSTLTFGTGNGGLMTVGVGSLAESVDSSTPNYATVAGGSTGVTMGVIKFRATNEDINLTKIGLTMTSGTASDVGTVYLYNGSTLLGTVVFPQGNNAISTSTLISPLKLTKDTDTLVTIKSDLATIGSGQSGTQGKLVKIDPQSAEGLGLASGSTLMAGGVTPAVNGVRTFKSFPTVAADTLSGTGVADGHLMRFKITANSSGPVGIYALSFTIATSGTASANTQVSSVKLYAYTDSAYSSPATTATSDGEFGVVNGTTGGTTLPINPTILFQSTTNALEIPAGATYYFDLKASVAGVTTGSSVTTTLLGDTPFNGMFAAPAVTTNFVWSGNATTTANITTDDDWANGFGISGLPSSGFSVTRSQ